MAETRPLFISVNLPSGHAKVTTSSQTVPIFTSMQTMLHHQRTARLNTTNINTRQQTWRTLITLWGTNWRSPRINVVASIPSILVLC